MAGGRGARCRRHAGVWESRSGVNRSAAATDGLRLGRHRQVRQAGPGGKRSAQAGGNAAHRVATSRSRHGGTGPHHCRRRCRATGLAGADDQPRAVAAIGAPRRTVVCGGRRRTVHLQEHLPTAAVAVLQLHGSSWQSPGDRAGLEADELVGLLVYASPAGSHVHSSRHASRSANRHDQFVGSASERPRASSKRKAAALPWPLAGRGELPASRLTTRYPPARTRAAPRARSAPQACPSRRRPACAIHPPCVSAGH